MKKNNPFAKDSPVMNIAVISTGTELLRGGTVNTNLASLGTDLVGGGADPVL